MIDVNTVYLAVAAYGLSALLGIFNLKNDNPLLGGATKLLLLAGIIIQIVIVVHRWVTSGIEPMVNTYEISFMFILSLTILYLYFQYFMKIQFSEFIVSLVAAVGLFYVSFLYSDPQNLMPVLKSHWLKVHVSCYIIGYSTMAMAYLIGLFYMVRQKGADYWTGIFFMSASITTMIFGTLDKSGVLDLEWYVNIIILNGIAALLLTLPLSRMVNAFILPTLPDEEKMDQMIYKLIAFGFPFLTFGVITGAIWANKSWGRYWGFDAKETWSLISWLAYAIYLHFHLRKLWRKKWLIWIVIFGFFTIMFTWLGVNYLLSGLHSYSG